MHRVFMYGTLKSGQPNHGVLTNTKNGQSRFIGSGLTSTKWPLVIASQHNIPYLLDAEGVGHHIHGEVYDIDDAMMKVLDDYEQYPDIYDRRKINIYLEDVADGVVIEQDTESSKLPGPVVDCWFYLLPKADPALLSLEKMADYDSNGPHGKPYISIYDVDQGWKGKLTVPGDS